MFVTLIKKHKNNTGSISIFLCLICSLLLSITFVTIDSCRISAMKAYVEGISYLTLDSALGNFSIPLLEDYHLLGISMNQEEIETFINTEIKKNINPAQNLNGIYYNLFQIKDYNLKDMHLFHLTDNNGIYFIRQIQNAILQNPLTVLQNIYSLSSCISLFSKESMDLKKLDTDITFIDNSYDLSEFKTESSENNFSSTESFSESNSLSQETAAQKKKSILSRIKDLLINTGLTFYIENPSDISSLQIKKANLPSANCSFQKKNTLSVSEKLLYQCYLTEHFSCYTDNTNSSTALQYQLEYLLNGNPEDDENLLQSIVQIQTLRTGLNLAYLYTDTEKRNLIYQIAYTAVGAFTIPFLVEFTQFALLSAWATAEAILDVQNLLKGNKIPFLKSKNTWNLSFDELTTFDKSKTTSVNASSGFNYKEYLCLLLFHNFSNTTVFRTMDLIQLNICKNQNTDFRMSECVTAIRCEHSYTFSPLFQMTQFPSEKNVFFSHTFIQQKSY